MKLKTKGAVFTRRQDNINDPVYVLYILHYFLSDLVSIDLFLNHKFSGFNGLEKPIIDPDSPFLLQLINI